MNAPRIVHIITGLGQGGAEAMLEKLVLAARRAEPALQQQVISLGEIGVVGARLQAQGVPVLALGLRGAWPLLAGFSRLVAHLRRQHAPLLVQTWMYHADLIGGLAARLAGHRHVVWNVRQTGLDGADIGPATRAVVRLCGALSGWLPARIVCNAQAAIAAHAALGYAADRFTVLPNGFDTQVFTRQAATGQALRRAWGVADDALLVGMVARLDPQKDHANFIAAAQIVAAALPAARFVLAGRGIPDDPALGRLIAQAGLSQQVLRLGQRSDVAALMSTLDLFCLSSRAEGFPNVLGEAMACETPAVSTDAGDARALLGDDALVAPIQDAPALAACVLRVASLAPAQRRALGLQQRLRIVAEYDIHRVWARYRALYTDVLQQA